MNKSLKPIRLHSTNGSSYIQRGYRFFQAIEQIIAVTHSEAFAEKAEHVIILEKEAGISKISLER